MAEQVTTNPDSPAGGARRRVSVAEALARLPGAGGERFAEVFRHGSLSVEIYAPRGADPQQPHTRDEAYVVVSGSGGVVNRGQRPPGGPGGFLFLSAGVGHPPQGFT